MKTGIELISEERKRGYNNLKEKDFASDMIVISKGIQFAYKTDSDLKKQLLTKAGALIAAEIDRLQKNELIQI